jgi:RNA polymerase sigma-70 factor (ECF subfamily)
MDAIASLTNEELLLKFAASSAVDPGYAEEVFAELVRRFRAAMFGWCRRYLGKSSDADDAVQRALINVWKHAGSYRNRSKAGTWIYVITRNAAYDVYRQRMARRRRVAKTHKDFFEQLPERLADAPADEELAAVRVGLANLQPIHRSVVELVYLGEQPYEAAAGALGVPIGTIRSRLHRALALLRESLSAPCN